MKTYPIYLETGSKKVFAAALEWPGWCRVGGSEAQAVAVLTAYGRRYMLVMQQANIDFQAPKNVDDLEIVERVTGNATTDFGAPNISPSMDMRPLEPGALDHLAEVLSACWQALAGAANAASGKSLHTGLRGGGRDLQRIIQHVIDSEGAYLNRLGIKVKASSEGDILDQIAFAHQSAVLTFTTAVRQGLPELGPRGGAIWPAWTYARRSAWHLLDHAWEIEDRIQ